LPGNVQMDDLFNHFVAISYLPRPLTGIISLFSPSPWPSPIKGEGNN
jgi:hypothetical protein